MRGWVAAMHCCIAAPLEPCMRLSMHTARAAAKAPFGTRFHNGISRALRISMATGMVQFEIACCVRSTFGSFHNVADNPVGAHCNRFPAVRTQAVLPEPDAVKLH